MKILLSQFAAFNLWANELLVACIKNLPGAVQKQTVNSSFPSLCATLQHMLVAESVWYQRIKLLEPVVPPQINSDADCSAVADALLQQSKQWQQWVQQAQPHMFDHEFIYYNSKKEKFKQPVFQVLLHVFNHNTYHRGQLVTLLRQLGVQQIPATDFIEWSRKKMA